MTTKRRDGRAGRRAKPRLSPQIRLGLGAAALLPIALIVLLAVSLSSTWDASTPMGFDDLTVLRYRAGTAMSSVRLSSAQKSEANGAHTWALDGLTMYFNGTLPRLTGAEITGAGYAGPRGLRVGEALDSLYAVIPLSAGEDPPDDYALLYAAGIGSDGLPVMPYGVVVPHGDALRAHLVAPTQDGAGLAICDVFADPDTNLIQRIRWELAPSDGFWAELLRTPE